MRWLVLVLALVLGVALGSGPDSPALDFLPLLQLAGAVLGVYALKLAGPVLADLAGGLPVVGPWAGVLVRQVTGQWAGWLREELPALARKVVLAVESQYSRAGDMAPEARAANKERAAVSLLSRLAPGVPVERLTLEIRKAAAEIKAEGYEIKAKSPVQVVR